MVYDKELMKQAIEKTFFEFIATRTDTGSIEERNSEGFFKKYFDKIPYLKENPDHCGFFKIPDDYLERSVPWCLLKGNGSDTIVFIHHHDIVETKNYLKLEPLALNPLELEAAFKEGKMPLPKNVQDDLFSGEWFFGRGTSDMKAGASIQLSLFEEYAKHKDFNGNIIILSVPDEENLSAGMRAGISLLRQLKDKYGLNYILMLNSEPSQFGPNNETVIYDGSVGKMLPVVFVQGKLAHVQKIYDGFNAANLLSEIVTRTEANPEFIEKYGNAVSVPPSWLYVKDLKNIYDVSLPTFATGFLSVLSLKKSPVEIMNRLKEICEESFEKILNSLNISYAKYLEEQGLEPKKLPYNVNVKLYSDLFEEAKRDSGEEFATAYNELMENIKLKFRNNEINAIESSNLIIRTTLEYVKDLSPQVIIALAPPYYPCVNNSMLDTQSSKNATEVLKEVVKYAKDNFNEDYFVGSFKMGITDLSYGFLSGDETNISYIANNMLMWKHIYYIPLEDMTQTGMPVMNIGPKGIEHHQYTERVLKKDLFYITPELINLVVERLLGN